MQISPLQTPGCLALCQESWVYIAVIAGIGALSYIFLVDRVERIVL